MSSTAHLLIAEKVLRFDDPGGVFTVMIQLGSVLAVMWLYREKILRVAAGLTHDADARRFAMMLIVAFVPAVVAGGLLSDYIKSVLYESPQVFAAAFIAGGIVILLVEKFRPVPDIENAEHTPVARAFGVGLCQTLALIPGVSRSGATIIGGMLMRLDRAAAAEFSFFLAMPTLGAAFVKSLWEVRHDLSPDRSLEIAIGFVAAFIASAIVVRPFLRYVARSGFGPFAWYRILAGIVVFAAVGAGWL